jgi:hypothetical protein
MIVNFVPHGYGQIGSRNTRDFGFRFFIKHRDDYYHLLLSVTRDAVWEEWVLFVLRGTEETAGWTLTRKNHTLE